MSIASGLSLIDAQPFFDTEIHQTVIDEVKNVKPITSLHLRIDVNPSRITLAVHPEFCLGKGRFDDGPHFVDALLRSFVPWFLSIMAPPVGVGVP